VSSAVRPVVTLLLPPPVQKGRNQFPPSFLQRSFEKASSGFCPQNITNDCDFILTLMAAFDVHTMMYFIVATDFVAVACTPSTSD